jgi:hypothetical protein
MSSKTSHDGRQRYWWKQIETWKASGQSQKGFCNANNLNYPQFVYWLRKYRQQPRAERKRASDFIPVTLSAPEPATELILVLPSGLELRGISQGNIALVQQLLGRLA